VHVFGLHRFFAFKALMNEQLIKQYVPLVRLLAYQYIRRLPPNIEIDDLIQVGLMAIDTAEQSFVDDGRAEFKSWLNYKVNYALTDYLRDQDPIGRTYRQRVNRMHRLESGMTTVLGRKPTQAELAEATGLTLEKAHEAIGMAAIEVVSLPPAAHSDDGDILIEAVDQADTPAERLQRKQRYEALVEQIGYLPERERRIMALYFDEGLLLSEISAIFKVTESRVTQIVKQAITRLKLKLCNY
jgi:RNA polymerase sigma factor for flagellar operon FliA